jgi:DNA polymerase-3 subunit delta
MARRAGNSPKDGGVSAHHRIILLHGKEHFRIAEATKKIEAALRERFGEIDTFTFDGAATHLATLLDELRSYSLMQTHKLVILDNADEFLVEKKDEDRETGSSASTPTLTLPLREGEGKRARGGRAGKAAGRTKPAGDLNRRALERYAENPVDHATLLLRAQSWKPGTLDKLIAKVGRIEKFADETEASAVRFAVERARDEYTANLDRAAAGLLVERLGTSFSRLDTEIAKLASLIEPGGTIAADLVREVVGKSREEQAWDIQEAVLTGDRGHALTKVNELLEISQAPRELIIWSLVDLVRKLHTASSLLAQGASSGEAMKQARMWGPAANPMMAAARKHSPHRLASLLHRAVQLDARTKNGLASAERTLEGLTVTLADMLK